MCLLFSMTSITFGELTIDMASLSFNELGNSILSLFERKKENHLIYIGIQFLNPTCGAMELNERFIESCIGKIDDFRDWLDPELYEFFRDFGARYFCSSNERINRRRYFAYEKIVKSKLCKRDSFKRAMMKELLLDLSAFKHNAEFSGPFTDTEVNRRKLFLNCIKNYVYRLFLIDVHCYP